MRDIPPFVVDPDDIGVLQEWAAAGTVGAAVARRARIVLGSADGRGSTALAAELGCSPQTVLTWRERYRAEGLAGLKDAPRPGRPVSVDPAAVVERTLRVPPPRLRAPRWSSRLLGAELGVSNVAVAKVWRSWGISPLDGGLVRLATDPPLDRPLAGVAGIHIDAADRVLAVIATDRPGSLPLRDRPRLGARLDDLDHGGAVNAAGLAHLLHRLDAVPGERIRLLVDRATPELARVERRGGRIHVAPAGLAWARFVRVAVVLAGSTEHGAASVAALRRAVVEHTPGRPLRWVAPDPIVVEGGPADPAREP